MPEAQTTWRLFFRQAYDFQLHIAQNLFCYTCPNLVAEGQQERLDLSGLKSIENSVRYVSATPEGDIALNRIGQLTENIAEYLGRHLGPLSSKIFSCNDLPAIGARGASGSDIAIVGYHNTFLAVSRQISLTAIDSGNTEIALKATEFTAENPIESGKQLITYLLEPQSVIISSSKSSVRVR